MRFDEPDFAEFYNRQQVQGGYPGKLLPFILRELEGLFTVIDIGSGTGLISIPLVAAGYKVTAVEPSMEMINVMKKNIPPDMKSSLKIVNTPWENWEGKIHDAAIMIHSLYPMPDVKKAIESMNRSAGKKILIVRETYKMKTLSGEVRERLGLSINRDLNNEIISVLENSGFKWKTENIFEERKHPVNNIQSETDSVMRQLKLEDSFRDRVNEIITELICRSNDEIFFNAVFNDNAYIF